MTEPRLTLAIGPAVAGFLLVALLPSALAAQGDQPQPRVLTLPEAAEASLPGDSSGTKFGVAVRRGSGFPPPIIVEPEKEPSEAAEPEPVVETVTRPRSIGGY